MDQNTDQAKQQVVDRLKQANNVLVTVSNDPSVDQLAACIGISLALNKLGKHATAVYSGETPSTIEFLKPEDTIEKTTDSLRDFIISLDKAKADKLRYKVEDQVVRIFITPYRTSITDKDLDFSQGDFNVDVVLAIGVHDQQQLDQAITAHGRILHDATVVTLNTTTGAELGSVNWVDTTASSLSEMASAVTGLLGKDLLDEQISTALLTGIVAETERFSNEKTSADTMKTSATLMSAGANQQLVASELQEPVQIAEVPAPQALEVPVEAPEPTAEAPASPTDNGTLEIEHPTDEVPVAPQESEAPMPPEVPSEPAVEKVEALAPAPSEEIPAPPTEYDDPNATQPKVAIHNDGYQNPRQALQETTQTPAFSSTASAGAPVLNPATPSLDLPPVAPDTEVTNTKSQHETLEDIERQVHSPHLDSPLDVSQPDMVPATPTAHAPEELNLSDLQRPEGIDDQDAGEPSQDVDAARQAVEQAMAAAPTAPAPEPITALNAQPLGEPLRDAPSAPPVPDIAAAPEPAESMTMPLPPTYAAPTSDTQPQSDEPKAPSVPPPILPPPFGQN